MAKVDHEHKPRSWSGWAITREEFEDLVDEAARLVSEETSGPTEIEIRVPGFERPFNGVTEFRENLGDEEWTGASNVELTLRSGELRDRLVVTLDIRTIMLSDGVTLRLRGRNRRSRNAIEPDLVRLIEKHTRPVHSARRTLTLIAIPGYLLALASGVGLGVAMNQLGAGKVPILAASSICFMVLCGLAMNRVIDWTFRITQPVELLPDGGVTTWEAVWNAKRRQARLYGSALVGVSTVAALIVSLVKA